MSNDELILIGLRIRDVRMQRGLTQRELALKAGLTAANICCIEHGKSLGLNSIVALSVALDVSLDYLIRGIRPQSGAWGLVFHSDDELNALAEQLRQCRQRATDRGQPAAGPDLTPDS